VVQAQLQEKIIERRRLSCRCTAARLAWPLALPQTQSLTFFRPSTPLTPPREVVSVFACGSVAAFLADAPWTDQFGRGMDRAIGLPGYHSTILTPGGRLSSHLPGFSFPYRLSSPNRTTSLCTSSWSSVRRWRRYTWDRLALSVDDWDSKASRSLLRGQSGWTVPAKTEHASPNTGSFGSSVQ
jgi:hypothetical protein